MVYEFVLKVFGKGVVEVISLLPFLLTLTGGTFQTEVEVAQPFTEEVVRCVKTGHAVTVTCELSLVVNRTHRFVNHQDVELVWRDSLWYVNDEVVGSVVPGSATFPFTYPGFRFHNGDELELFATVSLKEDSLFLASTGLRTAVFWNYHTPSRLSGYRFEDGGFVEIP